MVPLSFAGNIQSTTYKRVFMGGSYAIYMTVYGRVQPFVVRNDIFVLFCRTAAAILYISNIL